MNIKELKHQTCLLGESPVWDKANNCFYWADIIQGRIYRFSLLSEEVELIYETERQIGGMLLSEDNSLMLFTDKDVRTWNIISGDIEILYQMNFEAGERFNDAIADSSDRIWAGTMDSTFSKGKLYRFEKGKKPVVILENLGITNGMGFSSDNRFFYHTDSIPRTITKYEYNIRTGEITNGILFF